MFIWKGLKHCPYVASEIRQGHVSWSWMNLFIQISACRFQTYLAFLILACLHWMTAHIATCLTKILVIIITIAKGLICVKTFTSLSKILITFFIFLISSIHLPVIKWFFFKTLCNKGVVFWLQTVSNVMSVRKQTCCKIHAKLFF